MKVPASSAVIAVQRSGYPCSGDTLRQWVRRGHITRHGRNHYDLVEILSYLETRLALA